VEDGERLERALKRERKQEEPKYEEMCRRFLADQKDFSEENIRKAGIQRRFVNEDLQECIDEIMRYILSL
jgi:guanylate kinase